MTETAAIYCRISQDREGSEVGVENQEAAARKLARNLGVAVVRVYVDNDRGASTRSRKARPEYRAMLDAASAGEFGSILAYSNSRLTRRPAEWEDLIQLYADRGITVHTVQNSNYDLATADGRALARTVAAWDAAEAERTGERVAFAQAGKLAKGLDIGGPRPFGYEKDRLTIREEEAALLRLAYAMVLDGSSIWAITTMFTQSGVQRDRAKDHAWRTQTVRSILLRPRNCGRLEVKGIRYSDDLPAIIDVDAYERVRGILENPARAPRRGPKPKRWAAIGSIRCGTCGSFLSQSGSRKGNGSRHLRCSPHGRPTGDWGTHPAMEVNRLDLELAMKVFLGLITTKDASTIDAGAVSIGALRVKLAELVRRRDVVQELALSPGANLATAKRQLAELGTQISNAQAEIDTAVIQDIATAAMGVAKGLMDEIMQGPIGVDVEARSWLDHWEAMGVENRSALVTALFPRGLRLLTVQESRSLPGRLVSL